MVLNPDFARGANEIRVPANLREMCGWTDQDNPSEQKSIDQEKRLFGQYEEESPTGFCARIAREIPAEMFKKWTEFQLSKGRYEGSADWSLLDEFVHGSPLIWLPQIIGSCVCSNSFRPWSARLMYQVALLGDPMEYLGRGEFGTSNYSFYGPFSYGHARRKGNMRRGDGLYAAPFAWSLMQGVLRCDNPKLKSILNRVDLDADKDYPEPQGRDGASFYRAMGNWAHIDELQGEIEYPLAECPEIKSATESWDFLQAGKPQFSCSMEAIHKVGQHKDGFAIHARNHRDRWAHNMSIQGCFVASNGDRFFVWSNESWGQRHLYFRRFEEVDSEIRRGGHTIRAIGQIDGPKSDTPSIAA